MTSTAQAVTVALVLAILPAAALADDADAAPAVPAAAVAPPPKTLSYGVGLRVGGGYTSTTDTTKSSSVGIESLDVRPYISGQVHPLLKFDGSLDLNNSDQSRIHVLTAVAKFEPDDLFNVWLGRFLPPSDRANLSGPYFRNAWNYPDAVNAYPSIYAGRADGGALWGQIDKGRFKYQAGFFTLDPSTPANQGIYAGRLVYDFLDPEPGYYNSSTYYGTKDVLAIGGAMQFQHLGAGPATDRRDLLGFNLDLLFEKRLPTSDTLTLEGAYYNFNKGGQGWSFFGQASYLFGPKLGFGQVQPMARYQQLTPTAGGDPTRVVDAGINYVVDQHNTRFALVLQHRDNPLAPSTTAFQLGVQFQE